MVRRVLACLIVALLSALPLVAQTNSPAPPSAATGDETDFKSFLESNQVELMTLAEKHAPEIRRDIVPILSTVLWNLLGVILLSEFVVYLLLARVISQILVPLRATWKRAAIFALIQIGAALVMALVAFLLVRLFGSHHAAGEGEPSRLGYLIGAALDALIAIVILVLSAMRVYEVGRDRAVPFALLTIGGAFLVSVISGFILRESAAGSLPKMIDFFGPHIAAQIFSPYVQTELELARTDHVRLTAESNDLAARVAIADQTLQSADQEIEALGKKVAAREKDDDLLYAKLGSRLNPADISSAIQVYEEFARQHPDSPYAQNALAQAAQFKAARDRRIAADQAALAEKQRQDAEARTRFLAKIHANQATLSDIRAAILGKSREEVVGLFGQPTAQPADRFIYLNIQVADPIQAGTRPLEINFSEGRVLNVTYAH